MIKLQPTQKPYHVRTSPKRFGWFGRVFGATAYDILYHDTVIVHEMLASRYLVEQVAEFMNIAYSVGHIDGQSAQYLSIPTQIREQYEIECG